MTSQNKLLFIAGLFIVSLAAANVLSAAKLISVFGLTVDAGIICYPLTFLFTDIVAEVWGKDTARSLIWVGFAANLAMVLLIWIGGILPASAEWLNQEQYQSVLGSVPRIAFASMLAYLVSQHHDIMAFQFWRKTTRGKRLWMRNNFSTIVSQGLDTIIFGMVAFYGVVPMRILLGEIILAQYVIKVGVALLDTPLCYLLVAWGKGTKPRNASMNPVNEAA